MNKEERLLNIIKAQSDCIHSMWQSIQNLNADLDMLMTEDISKQLISLSTIPEATDVQTLASFIKETDLVKG